MFLVKKLEHTGALEFISSEQPGICSQGDFDHDVSAFMGHVSLFNLLIEKHNYKINLTAEEVKELRKFVESAVKDLIIPTFD